MPCPIKPSSGSPVRATGAVNFAFSVLMYAMFVFTFGSLGGFMLVCVCGDGWVGASMPGMSGYIVVGHRPITLHAPRGTHAPLHTHAHTSMHSDAQPYLHPPTHAHARARTHSLTQAHTQGESVLRSILPTGVHVLFLT